MNKPEKKLHNLLKFKIEVQEEEKELITNKKKWRSLGEKVREHGQKVGDMKRTLFEMI